MQRHRVRSVPLSALALILALAAAPAVVAQQPGIFSEVIDVRVVNIEVVVTEKGDRVTGLGADDFLLTVDGREVPIEYFTEVLGGTAVVPGADSATVPALAPGEDVNTSYLVFVDDYFSRPNDRDRVLQRMIEQLPNLLPGDRMAVVAFDGKKVDMLSTWSQSVESLTRVLERARDRPAYGLQREAERRVFELTRERPGTLVGEEDRFVRQLEPGGFGDDLTIDERQLAEMITGQVGKVVLAASSTLRSFANPPGRKVMLLLSGGWPYNPAYWVINDPSRALYVSTELRDGERLYRPLTETANRLSYTLYTVDVPGIDTTYIANAGISEVEEAERRATLERDREIDEHVALRTLARDTGGRALIDSAGIDALQRTVEDTRSYYWLGFTPDWQGDDASHKVEVKTRRKGLKVRSRRGFSDLSRETEVTMMVESSLLFGDSPSAAPLGAAIGPGRKAGRGKLIVPLKVLIPLGQLTFLPAGDGWMADTELRVAVLDEEGNTSDIPVIPLGINVEKKPEEGRFTVYEVPLKVRKQKHGMVVSIYDKASGKILSTRIEVDPQEAERRRR